MFHVILYKEKFRCHGSRPAHILTIFGGKSTGDKYTKSREFKAALGSLRGAVVLQHAQRGSREMTTRDQDWDARSKPK